MTPKFDGWPRKTIGHIFYAMLSVVYHFKIIDELKLVLQSGNTQFGSKSAIFFLSRVTLKFGGWSGKTIGQHRYPWLMVSLQYLHCFIANALEILQSCTKPYIYILDFYKINSAWLKLKPPTLVSYLITKRLNRSWNLFVIYYIHVISPDGQQTAVCSVFTKVTPRVHKSWKIRQYIDGFVRAACTISSELAMEILQSLH